MSKILVACEYSGRVREAFRALGHDAWSCDLLESEDNSPYHITGDVMTLLTQGFDMMLAFPPCTHLAVSGAKYFAAKRADGRQKEGIDFFMQMVNAPINKIAIENPVGIMSSIYRKPDQIIQPWQFGDPFQKTTCLWLKNLPLLTHTQIVDKGDFVTTPSGKRLPKWYSDNKSAKNRSRTFQGIANAMAAQWSQYITESQPTKE
jgi:hypothetical protein